MMVVGKRCEMCAIMGQLLVWFSPVLRLGVLNLPHTLCAAAYIMWQYDYIFDNVII